MRVFATGGSGVLGRALLPLLLDAGHDVAAPGSAELDLFDPAAVRAAVADRDAVYHLATRIPPRERRGDPEAWRDNDRLRRDASRILVDAALAASVRTYVLPSVTFLYPQGEVDETTPIGVVPPHLVSMIAAEREAERFAASGRHAVVLRLGLLDGPGTGPEHTTRGQTVHVADAAHALVLALAAPSGTYNVVRDGERVANRRFTATTGWRPAR